MNGKIATIAISALMLISLISVLQAGTASAESPTSKTFTFTGGSLTTTNTDSWGGYNSHSYGVHFNIDAGPVTVEYLGVNAYPINYTGDFGWPPDPTDTGASVIVGLGDGTNIAQYSFKSNMSGEQPRVTDPVTYGKGSWNAQTTGHWNDDGYRSYLFQGQFTGNWVETKGNSQYNAEKHGGPTGVVPDYDTFDIKIVIQKVATNTYEVTGWHNLWKSSAIDEGCGWDWNYAKNAHDPAKQGYLKCFEGTWTADGGLDLSDVEVFLAIQNWQGTQPELHTFDWDSVVVTGTVVPPSKVWVDGNWTGKNFGDQVDGHTFGYDTFAKIQDAIDAVAEGGTVHVAAGTYKEHITIVKSDLNLIGADKETTIIDATQDPSWTYPKPGILLDGIRGVTISGFTIRDAEMQGGVPWNNKETATGPGPQALAGILIYGSSDSTIEYNIFINNHWQIFLCAEAAAAGYTDCDNNRIANNTIRDSEQDGVYLYSDGGVSIGGTEIVNNEISNAYGDAASGVEFWGCTDGGPTPTISGTVIRNNDITNCTYGVRIREGVSDITGTLVEYNNISDSDGILVQSAESITILNNTISDFNKFGIVAEDVGSVTIENNTIITTDYSVAPNGIQISGDTETTGSISNNIISGCHWDGYDPETQTYEDNWTGSGILVIAPNSALTISGNEVRDSDVGLDIEACSGTLIMNNDVHNNSYGFVLWNANPTINYNNIYQNGLCGVYRTNDLIGTLDATLNWWGNPSGPGSVGPGLGDNVSESVEYCPWITKPFQTVLDERIGYYGFGIPLEKGWNTFSTPILLEDDSWEKISSYIDDSIAYVFDASKQAWVQITTDFDYHLKPLDAVYVRMNSDDSAPLMISGTISSPPTKPLENGWNLIGPTMEFMVENMPMDQVLKSVEYTPSGLMGYTVVVSPPLYQDPWVYTRGQNVTSWMCCGRGYWVYMENPDTLVGFSTTPISLGK